MCNMIQDALKKRDFLEDAIILAMQGCFNKERHEGILFKRIFSENMWRRHCHQVSRPSFP